jgi:hypothetical protein
MNLVCFTNIFSLIGDKQRREFLEKQYQMSEEKRREQQELIREIISREKVCIKCFQTCD